MEESPSPLPSSSSSPLTPAEQARIRRERRRAKVRAGGNSRLNKITGTQGQTFRNEDDVPPPQVAADTTPDPPDVDISDHHYEPKARQQERVSMQDLLAGANHFPMFPRSAATAGAEWDSPFAGPGEQSEMDLRQLMTGNPMLGGVGGADGFGGAGIGDPVLQMMQNLMGGGDGSGPGMPIPEIRRMQQREESWGKWWKVVHLLCGVLLSLWIVRSTGWTFTGTSLERVESENLARSEKPVFWYFTTMELILQSARFFLEKGRPPPGSWLTTIGSFLPPPVGTFLTTIARYSVIWTTLMVDAGVLIFCLGMASLWNS